MALTAGAVKKLAILPDQSFIRNSTPQGSSQVPSYIENKTVVTAGTAVYMTVPTGAKRVIFGATGNFCVRLNKVAAGTDAASFADTNDGRGCEVNPAGFYFTDTVAELSFNATANSTTISCAFYL